MARQLVTKGYQAYVLAPGSTGSPMFKVQIGRFKTEAGRREDCRAREEGRDSSNRGSRGSAAARSIRGSACRGCAASGPRARVRRSARPQFPPLRLAASCLGRARAPACGASHIAQSASGTCVRARTGHRCGVFRGHRVLDQRRHGAVPADCTPWSPSPSRGSSSRTWRCFPRCLRPRSVCCLVRFGRRALLLAPAVWVSTEYAGRTVLFGGFPVGAPGLLAGQRPARRAARVASSACMDCPRSSSGSGPGWRGRSRNGAVHR